tara:strand:+ start:3769 stop:4074 length:306 start_codon:yes stop_codon:yes gene_type:complete
MVKFYNNGDLLLDVDTRFWGLNTTGINNVWYISQIRLIDAYTKKDLAADTCTYKSSDIEPGSTPTYGELVDNNEAALLKQYLSNAAHYCASTFLTKNLNFQ